VNGAGLLFTLPALGLIGLFFVAPVVLTLGMSLTDMSSATGLGRWQWVGLENYERIFGGRFTPIILRNTLVYVGTVLAFNVLAGLGVALLSAQVDERAGGFFRAVWLLPRLSPSVVYALMWAWAAAPPPFGIANALLGPLGVEPRAWLTSDPWPILILLNGFVGASFGMLIFTGALRGIPLELFRAARVDGASSWQIVRRVTLPLLRWPILFVVVYQAMSLFASYELILLTTDGGPGLYTTEVWSLWAYHTALNSYSGNLQFGFGAALAAVLVVMALVVSAVLLRVFRFGQLAGEPPLDSA
jgi:inositol-phosphate transport system permease protein